MVKEVLGDLYFKRVSYVITAFNDRSKTKGFAIVCESSMQRGPVFIDVLLEGVPATKKDELNYNSDTFNAKVFLENPRIILKNDGKYKIVCDGIKMEKGA